MTAKNHQVDRRKHRRFRVPESAFVTLRAPDVRVAQIIDISRGGLAFRYIGEGLTKRNSVQFGQLTAQQMSQLQCFIRDHTVGEM
jgi:hypothetical protein